MPSTYAHRRFGADVLQQLPAALQDQIGKNRALFDVGLHGPDLLFYYHAAKSNPWVPWQRHARAAGPGVL